jgi:hypothetical protein
LQVFESGRDFFGADFVPNAQNGEDFFWGSVPWIRKGAKRSSALCSPNENVNSLGKPILLKQRLPLRWKPPAAAALIIA